MAFFRKMLQRLFGWFGTRASQPEHFMDPEEARRLGYKVTPGASSEFRGPDNPSINLDEGPVYGYCG
jgi:hypothetical protein